MSSPYRVIDGCPCNTTLAPYIHLVLRKAGQQANSIYRGTDPAATTILHAHGKHNQAELYATLPKGVANPPGRSTHELKSDGVAYPAVQAGGDLAWWQQGVDSGADTQAARRQIEGAAKALGWTVFHAYNAGTELHHWNFKVKPRPRNAKQVAQIIHLRHTMAQH